MICAGTLGVPLGGPRHVGGLLGVAGRLSHKEGAVRLISEEGCLERYPSRNSHTGLCVGRVSVHVFNTDAGLFVKQSTSPWIQQSRSCRARVQYYTATTP